jgi:hypothetical protein
MLYDILKMSVYVIKLNKVALKFDRLIYGGLLTLSIALLMRCRIVGWCVSGELHGSKMKPSWLI